MKEHNNDAGFTLIEVIVALAVLSIGIFSLYSMQITSMDGNSKANLITNAASWGADQTEQIMGLDYDGYATSVDKEKDALTFDLQEREADQDGLNGINDATQATADWWDNSADGNFILYWNIVDDYPMTDTKTIRVLIRDTRNNLNNIVVVDYIKNNAI